MKPLYTLKVSYPANQPRYEKWFGFDTETKRDWFMRSLQEHSNGRHHDQKLKLVKEIDLHQVDSAAEILDDIDNLFHRS